MSATGENQVSCTYWRLLAHIIHRNVLLGVSVDKNSSFTDISSTKIYPRSLEIGVIDMLFWQFMLQDDTVVALYSSDLFHPYSFSLYLQLICIVFSGNLQRHVSHWINVFSSKYLFCRRRPERLEEHNILDWIFRMYNLSMFEEAWTTSRKVVQKCLFRPHLKVKIRTTWTMDDLP